MTFCGKRGFLSLTLNSKAIIALLYKFLHLKSNLRECDLNATNVKNQTWFATKALEGNRKKYTLRFQYYENSTYSAVQWAAVRIHFVSITEPPQMWYSFPEKDFLNEACQGNAPIAAFWPPSIRGSASISFASKQYG